MKVLVTGDFCEKYRIADEISRMNFNMLFDNVKPLILEHDFRVINFEFPITRGILTPIRKNGPTLSGSHKSIEALRYAGFNVCTLANNHIMDQGSLCCLDTKRSLEKAGIYTVGVGENLTNAGKILYLKQDKETLAIINCCENEFSISTTNTPGANPLNPILQYHHILEAKKNADFVLLIVHGGHEHCQLPSPRMKELYHFFIEVGADAIVNHHQHCYSGYEVYNGRPIFYGIGNFLFDNKEHKLSNWNEGYMVSLNFSIHKGVDFKIHPYRQCAQKPTVIIMDGVDLELFNKNIGILNDIINQDECLKSKWESWIAENSSYFLLDFQPYFGRFFKALFTRGLLPSFITSKKKYSILNHITCESHLDRLRYMIRK